MTPIEPQYGDEINVNTPKQAENVVTNLTEKEGKLLLGALNEKIGNKKTPEKKEISIYRIKAENVVRDLTEKEGKLLLDALNEKIGNKKNLEKKEFNREQLLNKPEMTIKDKKNMKKCIKFLVDEKMDTSSNFKRLEAIKYGKNYIKIGPTKRARKNLKVEPEQDVDILEYGDEVYFNFYALERQKKFLAEQGMKIPGIDIFIGALKVLPRKFLEDSRHTGGHILWNILDLSMCGGFDEYNMPINKGQIGNVWSSSEFHGSTWYFGFIDGGGEIGSASNDCMMPVRPIFI